jgi:hypothetical protein
MSGCQGISDMLYLKSARGVFGVVQAPWLVLWCLLLCAVLSGCEDPEYPLVFVVDGKEERRPTIHIADGQVRLKVEAGGRFRIPSEDAYVLGLSIKVEVGGDLGVLRAVPCSVKVLFENAEMSPPRYSPRVFDTLLTDYYEIHLSFECQPRLDTIGRVHIAARDKVKAHLKIVLDDFLYFDGDPVHIDTLHAFDSKADRHLYELIQPR